MIIFDIETTGLLGPTALPLNQQPQIIEFAGINLDDKLKEVSRLHTLINPGTPLPPEIIKITGIVDADLQGKPSFAGFYPELVEFFLGKEVLVAHNLPFDRGMLSTELQRIDRLLELPWPPKHVCTAELTEHLEGKYLKQEQLYEIATGEPANQTHRAMDDAEQLVTILRWLRKEHKLI